MSHIHSSGTPRTRPPVLATLQVAGDTIEDFRPFCESLEWQVGQEYLRSSGATPFVSDAQPVPFIVHNDGDLSARAAELLFAALEHTAPRSPRLQVLEIGVGVGLFARHFLDRFRGLCAEQRRDYYERLTYVLGDYSARMLRDVGRHGVLAGHRDRYRLRVVNALAPQEGLRAEVDDQGTFHAVFLNYLLDCLPAAVLRIDESSVRQLCVRTCLRRGTGTPGSGASAAEVRRLLHARSSAARDELRKLADGFVAEYEFQDCDWRELPLFPSLERSAKTSVVRVHSHGAIQCLQQVSALLAPRGFILMHDYPALESSGEDEWFEHQRYSGGTFVGVNFAGLRRHFEAAGFDFIGPAEDRDTLVSRLMGKDLPSELIDRYRTLFEKSACEASGTARAKAKGWVGQQRYETALLAYRKLLAKQPYDWVSWGEAAEVLTFGLRDPAAGLTVIREALALNPRCSSNLWAICGDCLWELGRLTEAIKAFRRAVAINPRDVRAHHALAGVYLARRDGARALAAIAAGLAVAPDANWTQQLLSRQSDILTELHRSLREEQRRLANRVRPTRGGDPAPATRADYEPTR